MRLYQISAPHRRPSPILRRVPGPLLCLALCAPLAARGQEGAAPSGPPAAPAPAAPPSGPAPTEGAPAEDAPAAPADATAPGAIEGQVLDARTGRPIADAWIGVAGSDIQGNSDAAGRFRVEVPPGRHDLNIAYDLYQGQTVAGVIVAPGQTQQLPFKVRMRLEPPRPSEVHVIREPDRNSTEAQNLVRQNSARVTDVVSAEDIKKAADSSSAQTAARVVGATVVGDRFVYVRGLGERYANALFNGAPLPSPEPDQQAVPFDIFPANLLANLTIAKSATPDLPADFAGGSVQINTREFTSKFTLGVTAQLGANLGTAFQPFLAYPGGATDWLGFDDGTRAAPQIPTGLRGADGAPLSRKDVGALGQKFRDVWVPRQADLGAMDGSLAVSVGDQRKFGARRIGYLVSLSYNLTNVSRTEERHVYNLDNGALRSQTDLTGTLSTREVQWGGLVNLSYVPGTGHRLALSGIFTQNSEDEARVQQGYRLENNTDVWTSRLRWVQRTFGFVQLGGDHLRPASGKLLSRNLEWRLTYARASREEPDTRETYYLHLPQGIYGFYNSGNSGQRFYSDNGEHQVSAGVDLTQGFNQWAHLPAALKLGALVRLRFREFSARRYQFFDYGVNANGDSTSGLPPEQLFAPDNISTKAGSGVELRDNTQPSDHYTGRMGIYAAYAMVDLPLASRVRLVGGARFEAALQSVDALSFTGAPVQVGLDNFDVLPSLNLVVRATDQMNLRGGVSMTVARPEFRELSPFQFTDFFGGETVRGNPDLQRTRIVNADLRWEWFVGAADLVAASVFYKYFDQPIESILFPGGNLIRSFANVPSAHNLGGELEGRKDLGFASGALSGLSIGGNLSLIYSRVDLTGVTGVQTSKIRALQGQSPYVVNAFVELDRPGWGLQARAQYNVFGERIDSVGALGLPDKYQQPRHMLDVTVTQRLGRGLSLRASGRNLLDSPVYITQGAETVLRYSTGRVVNLALLYNY